MRWRRGEVGPLGFALRVGAVGVAVASVVLVAILAPDLAKLLPSPVRRHRCTAGLATLAAAYVMARGYAGLARSGAAEGGRLPRLIRRVDEMASAALSGRLSIAIAAACLIFLATWLPHYVLWPWGRDADTFATLAQSWDAGIRPYRDIRGYNFPGAIYLFWLLGKVFGWGPTWPLYAIDAAGLIGLGLTLIAWSRRCLGQSLPALVSCLIFLTYYLSHEFQNVAQRDWHTGLCIALGLLSLQGWPGRTSRVLSALLAAAALAIRPHAVLFLPAMASAVLEGADRADAGSPEDRAASYRPLAAWLLMLAAFTAMAFAPLVLAGIADDLVRGLRIVAYGGPYSRADPATVARAFVDELNQPGIAIAIAMLGFLLVATRGTARRRAVTWSLAMAAALAYRPVHPVQHRYLDYPIVLIGSISLAPSIAWITERAVVPAVLRAIVVLGLIGEISLGIPTYCDLPATLEAIATIARGEVLTIHAPPGTGAWFAPRTGRWYPWKDYRNTLIYLRATVSPTTQVANVLRMPPFPAINGPAGRLSPFRAESGICWMWMVPIDLESEFIADLERTTDSVVVWSPQERRSVSKLTLDRLAAVIRDRYRLEARFGRIEVWRRADDARAGASPRPEEPARPATSGAPTAMRRRR